MDKKRALKYYSTIGINTQTDLFKFVINNDKAFIDNKEYNLTKSNESMEFMALFLEALDFDVTRLYVEKKDSNSDKRHWFLAFSNGINWFYFEVNLKDIIGKYSFKNYNSLISFAMAKIVRSLEKIENNSSKIYIKYSLKEIKALTCFEIQKNIETSRDGKQVLVWENSNTRENHSISFKSSGTDEIKSRNHDGKNYIAFILGFVFTLAIGIFLIWILAMFYTNN